jgi:hypothetical protein
MRPNRAPKALAGGRCTQYLISAIVAMAAAAAMTSTALAGELRMVHHAAARTHRAHEYRIVKQSREPVAHAAGINTIVPVFKLYFGYNVAGFGRLQLTKFLLRPFYSSFEAAPSGGCLHCDGQGKFGDTKITGHTLTEKVVHGKRFMTARTQFIQSVTSPGEIGFFKVYGVNVNLASPGPYVLASGCTPANLALSNDEVFKWRTLPRVPCHESLPQGTHVAINVPIELSTTAGLQGTVTGHAGSSEWLIAFESEKPFDAQRGVACAPNALAEGLLTQTFFKVKVHGDFHIDFTTAPAKTPGFQCAYLQTGGLVRVTGGTKYPDGRVTASGNQAFFAGDTVAVTGPTSSPLNTQASITVTGTASVPEEVYVFAPYSPCQPDAQLEYVQDPAEYAVPVAQGPFSVPVSVTVGMPPPGVTTIYECAYLQLLPPAIKDGPSPTDNPLLASSITGSFAVP